MRRYNIENRKDAPECMDEPTFDELPFGHTWAESGPKVHETASGMFGALFIILFGSPFWVQVYLHSMKDSVYFCTKVLEEDCF